MNYDIFIVSLKNKQFCHFNLRCNDVDLFTLILFIYISHITDTDAFGSNNIVYNELNPIAHDITNVPLANP